MREELKLWFLSRTDHFYHDNFANAVVAAVSEDEAKHIHPKMHDGSNSNYFWYENDWALRLGDDTIYDQRGSSCWAHPYNVKAVMIGIAAEEIKAGDVICVQYNAG